MNPDLVEAINAWDEMSSYSAVPEGATIGSKIALLGAPEDVAAFHAAAQRGAAALRRLRDAELTDD